MQALTGLRGSSDRAQGDSAWSNGSNLLHRAPSEPPRNPAGVTCTIPFFDPLEAEFEKIIFTKIVALAMLYLVVFENLKKVNF